MFRARLLFALIATGTLYTISSSQAQTLGEKERFTATAIVNNNLSLIHI